MIYVLLPAHQVERRLHSLLGRIRESAGVSAEPWRLVVVDDGSTDESAAVAGSFARSLDIWLVRHARHLGPGAALRTGVRLVLEHAIDPEDVLVTMDADDSHDPELVPVLVRALRKRGADVAIASRFARGGGEPDAAPHRRALSRAASLLYRAAAPFPGVRDYASGYRAFRIEALREARAAAGADIPAAAGGSATLELLLRMRAIAASAAEVPLVRRRHADGRHGGRGETLAGCGRLLAEAVAGRLLHPRRPPQPGRLRPHSAQAPA